MKITEEYNYITMTADKGMVLSQNGSVIGTSMRWCRKFGEPDIVEVPEPEQESEPKPDGDMQERIDLMQKRIDELEKKIGESHVHSED